MKKHFFCALFFAFAALLSAASILSGADTTWKMLETARIAFESGEYGTALKLAEQAKQNKKSDYERYAQILTDAMKPFQVQQAGDELGAVLEVLISRDAVDAVDVLRFFVSRHSPEYFNFSVSNIITHIKKTRVFPEADFLIGRVYLYESELVLAKEYYTRAWEQSFALDIPEQRIDILYEMAHLAQILDDDELFEQSLLLVLSEDSYYTGQAASGGIELSLYDSIKGAIQKNYGADKIFQMYRADHFRSLEAYIGLAKFYRAKGMQDAFLKNAVLGSLTAFTRMYSIVAERDVSYEYKGVEDFFQRSMRYRDIARWSIDTSVWECFYYLYEAVNEQAKQTPQSAGFASEMLAILAFISPDAGVREIAYNKLNSLTR